MNVSPLDLRQQHFQTSFRGFNRVEVTSFLQAVADDYEQALRETDRLRQDLSRTEAILNEHREHEKTLKTTLLAAQKEPEKYRSLIVRIAGYSAYFVDLSPSQQSEIIARTEEKI